MYLLKSLSSKHNAKIRVKERTSIKAMTRMPGRGIKNCSHDERSTEVEDKAPVDKGRERKREGRLCRCKELVRALRRLKGISFDDCAPPLEGVLTPCRKQVNQSKG